MWLKIDSNHDDNVVLKTRFNELIKSLDRAVVTWRWKIGEAVTLSGILAAVLWRR